MKKKQVADKFFYAIKLIVAQVLLILYCTCSLHATQSMAQPILEKKVTVDVTNEQLKTVIALIEEQAGIKFIYSNNTIKADRRISYHARNRALKYFLPDILNPLQIHFRVVKSQILLYSRDSKDSAQFMLFVEDAPDTLIRGTITDEQGNPLQGVTVNIKGSDRATLSDAGGKYSVRIDGTRAVLVFSYVGFGSVERSVSGNQELDITLRQNISNLDDVVVIGYGTAKRKDLTGAVATISAREITKAPVANVVEALTGRLAGVQISTTEGSPDAEMKIRVRGGGSITGDNTPLLIVDGFPVGSIADIAPSDIESIDVLKDASSTAIYGSRGANGVIIVTTKSGKAGKMSISYNAYGGPREIAKTLDVLTPSDYVKWQYELAMLTPNGLDTYEKYLGNYQDMDLYGEVPANDWQELVFGRIGSTFNHNLSISGGSDKTRYAVSYNHIKDKAIMQLSGFKRDNLSIKLNNKPNKKISLDFSMRYSNTQIEGGGANEQNEKSSADSRLKYAMIYPPIPVTGLTNSSETDDAFNLYNPLVAISDNDRAQKRVVYNLNAGFSWKLTEDLQFRTEVGMDDYRNADDRFYGTTTYYIKNAPASENQGFPAVIFTKLSRESYRNTNTLLYDFKKLLSGNHNLNLLVGQEYIVTQQETHTSTVHGFPASFSFADATKLSAQGKANSIDNYLSPDDKLFSFFGRANYDFDGRYLLSATFRADGSSKFSESNRWGYFPSVAAAWRISSESFMDNASRWLDDLKLRASYGTAGNNNIPPGQMTQTFNVSNTTWVNEFNSFWAASKTMANPNLKWETTVTRNIGIDFTALGGKISGTIDLYKNSTKDLLIQFPTPGTGYDNQYRNMGETQNKGLEVSANWVAIDKENFGLTVGANIGFNKNKIVSLGLMENFGAESGWASTEIGTDYWVATGGSVGHMYGYRSAGRYEVSDFSGYNATTGLWELKAGVPDASSVVGAIRPGTMKLMNLTEGDNVVDISDRTIIGDANPKHTGGFNLSGRVYNFDINAIFNWSYGNDIYNANKIEYTSTSKYHSRNMIGEMADGKRWTNLLPDGTISNDATQLTKMNETTSMWSPYMSRFVFSDWGVEDGSFLRLNTLTIGYSLPGSLIKRMKIQNLRVYITGYNVFCLTNYTGFDPEVSTRRKTNLTPGVDYSAYPKSRLMVFGLNLNF